MSGIILTSRHIYGDEGRFDVKGTVIAICLQSIYFLKAYKNGQ